MKEKWMEIYPFLLLFKIFLPLYTGRTWSKWVKITGVKLKKLFNLEKILLHVYSFYEKP